ncbi:XRE family transcriptional regulator [Kitasatospora sp. NPDC092948]|uniref:XRE family transcriptional regulator n=1 Tax=Kitasatospora sp. NPDC092948 TaxID=3364088 RepID=UPI00381C0FCC
MTTIGQHIRAAREARRCSQQSLADELSMARWGKTAFCDRQQVYRWEKGLRVPREWLPFIERVLNIDLSEDNEGKATHEEDDDMRRRTLFTGAATIGAALALPRPAAARESEPYDAAPDIERLLFTPPAPQRASLVTLQHSLAAARAHFTAATYRELGATLPDLVATAEALRGSSTGRERELADTAAARSYVLATELAAKAHSDLAWASADRALQAAQSSGDPAVVGEAVRVLAITMRRAGRPAAAVDLLRRTATDLDSRPGPAARAVAATLWMTAAYTAACNKDASSAHDLMTGAAEAVDRLPADLPPQQLYTVDATPAQVDLYRIGIHTALGNPDHAVRYATRITPAALPTAERRARLGTDTARMWQAIGDGPRTLAALRFVERVAPEEVRRPALRTMVTALVFAPMPTPGAREFARRIGIAG